MVIRNGCRNRRAVLVVGLAALLAGASPAVHTDRAVAKEPGDGPRATSADDGASEGRQQASRAVVSLRAGDGNFVSWRLLESDPPDVAFNLYRGSVKVNRSPITDGTNYHDKDAPAGARYSVRPVVEGRELTAKASDPADSVATLQDYVEVPLQVPSGGRTPSGENYTYTANDASVGDLDGDGEYELVLKWDPTNAKDNSQAGYTGNVYLDGYELDGTRLWRIDLGRNIRAGAHYTQFQVFDYDGDGSAEVAMKTADGTVDGQGDPIGNAGADYRNSEGYVLDGPEYLTVFNGRTGAAMDTTDYIPPRGNVGDWGDDYGNRVDRFLAGTAYLNGSTPSMIFSRGYYTRTVIAAWNWDGSSLSHQWTFDSDDAGSQYEGQGNHQLSVADADGDGRDEIMFGAMAIDDDGSPLWNARTGHGDAMHVSDLDPARQGLEVFKVSEDSGQPGSLMLAAESGRILWSTASGGDNGRGVSADIWSGSPGAESWSARDEGLRNTSGQVIGRKPGSINFVVWWDGDEQRELLDDTHIDKYGTNGDTRLLTGQGVASNNGTKATPALSADIMGDWREEVIWRTSDNRALRIYSTTISTEIRRESLMTDRQYRVAVAWQNTAYNQPPHPGFATP